MTAGEDATFFAEQSFGFDALRDELRKVSRAINNWKSTNGQGADFSLRELFEKKVKTLHSRFSRLVACYLIYRNSSRKALAAEAQEFGVKINFQSPENPLKYWILYLIVLLLAVYVGVYVSAIGYDLSTGQGLNASQDINRTFQWMLYSTSNYGLAIIVVLLLRLAGSRLGHSFAVSHLITYCWTFVVAFMVGPLGLTLALNFFGPARLSKDAGVAALRQQLEMGNRPGPGLRLHLLLSRPAKLRRHAERRSLPCNDRMAGCSTRSPSQPGWSCCCCRR